MNLHNLKRSTLFVLFSLLSLALAGCTIGPRGGGGDDDDATNDEEPNLPNNNVNVNVNVSVTMAGSGSGQNTGDNEPAGTDTYDGGAETDPGVLFVVNNSGLDIGELYITECDDLDDWGVNQLQGDYLLGSGEYVQIFSIPVGCWDLVAYDDDDEYAWFYAGAELTEEEPEFSLVLLPPEATGDDDDAADDDDVSDDDDAVGGDANLVIWNKGSVAMGNIVALDWDTEDEYYLCEWLPVGSTCGAVLPPGEYALYGSNESEWCWLETDPFTLGAGEDFDYYMGGSDVICK